MARVQRSVSLPDLNKNHNGRYMFEQKGEIPHEKLISRNNPTGFKLSADIFNVDMDSFDQSEDEWSLASDSAEPVQLRTRYRFQTDDEEAAEDKEPPIQSYRFQTEDEEAAEDKEILKVSRETSPDYSYRFQTEDEEAAEDKEILKVSRETSPDYNIKDYLQKQRSNLIYEELIKGDKVLYFIDWCGSRSKEVRLFLSWLCSIVEERFISAERVWAGHDPRFMSPLVFVAEVIEEKQYTPKLLWEFKIIQRLKGRVSDEAEYVSNMEIREGLVFTEEEQIAIKKCLTKHTVTLMKRHSNLLIVSAAKLKSKKHGSKDAVYEKTTCIVFYVHIKGIIPFGEEAFPTELEGFPVDVREGTFKTFSNPCDFHERLMMGCQIVTAYNMVCSLGGFIELESGNIGCLTCCHAFATEESVADFNKDPVNRSFLKKEVFQPHLSSDFEFGRLVSFIRNPGDSANIGVDAAVIEITKIHRHPNTGEFPDATSDIAGFSSDNPMVFSSGKIVERLEDIPIPCTVVKYGAGTGHTIGLLRLAGPAVHAHSSSFYPDDKIQLHQQFEVLSIRNQAFADKGDSGALVFMVNKSGGDMQVRALGLLVGGTDYGTTIVTPIWAVLNKLNLPLKLLSFESPVELAENPAIQRLEKIESDVKVLKQTTETTKRTVSSLENKLDSTDRKQGERSASIENKVSSVENKVSSLENKIDVIDREQAERSTSIKNEIKTSIQNELKTHHSDLSKKMDVLLNVVTSNK